MILVRLAGGLGNQLFQFAAALHLRESVTPIRLLTGALARYAVVRQPDLLRVIDCVQLGAHVAVGTVWSDKMVTIGRLGRLLPAIGVNERNFVQQEGGHRRTAWLDGYFQDAWTSDSFGAVARRMTDAIALPSLPDVERPELAIHVRGGDLLQNSQLLVVGTDWYVARLTQLYHQAAFEHAVVVTDDPAHTSLVLQTLRAVLPSVRFELVNDGDALSDFNMLRCARRRLVGNSTFALWATALDENRAPTVAPTHLGAGRPRRWMLPWETLA